MPDIAHCACYTAEILTLGGAGRCRLALSEEGTALVGNERAAETAATRPALELHEQEAAESEDHASTDHATGDRTNWGLRTNTPPWLCGNAHAC